MTKHTLPSLYQEFIHISRYSRWLQDEGRRETWEETVNRYFDFFEEHLKEHHGYTLTESLKKRLKESVLTLKTMPSMRALMTAGEALKRENIAGYNCSFVAIDKINAFDEILYILMNGVGAGFSVERQHVNKLPEVAEEFYDTDTVIKVRDSKLGWAKALKELIGMLYVGQIPKWDVSGVRPAGAPLKVFGGRASGPEPLVELFNFVIEVFKKAKGRKLTSIECHDIVCKIASVIVVGGVRRCLDSSYFINTNNGKKKITEIVPNVDKVVINGEQHGINALIDNGVQSVVNINMADGTTHTCTEDHRWFVYNHDTNEALWVKTKDLQNGRYSMLKEKG